MITKKRVKNDIIKELNNLYYKYKKDIQDIMKSNNNNESILKNNMFDFLLKQDSKYKRIKYRLNQSII